jgi:hypothetical protein
MLAIAAAATAMMAENVSQGQPKGPATEAMLATDRVMSTGRRVAAAGKPATSPAAGHFFATCLRATAPPTKAPM